MDGGRFCGSAGNDAVNRGRKLGYGIANGAAICVGGPGRDVAAICVGGNPSLLEVEVHDPIICA